MKARLIVCFSFLIFIACSHDKNHNQFVKFDFKNKDLHRLFYGNDYYKINGFSSFYEGIKYNLSKPNNFLILESELNEFNNNNKIILLDEEVELELYLHDLDTIKTQKITIEFNDYLKKTFSFIPVFSLGFLEKLKNRNSKIYEISDTDLLPFFIDELNYDGTDTFQNMNFYNNTSKNLKNLADFKLYPQTYSDVFLIQNPITDTYSLFPNLQNFKGINKNLSFPVNQKQMLASSEKKDVSIKNDTIISNSWKESNINLTISGGVDITMKNNASIFLKNSNVYINGSPESKINFIADGENSLYFENLSNIEILHTTFDGFSNLKNDSIILPSAITFYNSNVIINHSSFKNNIRGDDYINLYNSKFEILNSKFKSIYADGVDSDFSDGKIQNSIFDDIGNDAIDLSGSNVVINDSFFYKISDKSISVGENSKLNIDCNLFENSELGIVVKDGSVVKAEYNKFSQNKLDIAVFRKKNFYDQPILEIDTNLKNLKYLIQKKSKILNSYNDSILFTYKVEKKLYGNEYGKSSK